MLDENIQLRNHGSATGRWPPLARPTPMPSARPARSASCTRGHQSSRNFARAARSIKSPRAALFRARSRLCTQICMQEGPACSQPSASDQTPGGQRGRSVIECVRGRVALLLEQACMLIACTCNTRSKKHTCMCTDWFASNQSDVCARCVRAICIQQACNGN